MLAYKLAIVFALLTITTLLYLILTDWMQNIYLAATLAIATGISPGLSYLLSQFEDNLISSSIHVLYFFVYYQTIKVYRANSSAHRQIIANIFLPIIFALALMAHHQLVVLVITPLFLYGLLPTLGRVQRVQLICKHLCDGWRHLSSNLRLPNYALGHSL